MKTFYGDDLLLSGDPAKELYKTVKDLPIVDYHCHLNEKEIAENKRFSGLGELWLGGDHYKWRAMRLCGVDEKYITGDATFSEKLRKYAEIFPKLCGSPLYYWTQLELKLIFGIDEALCAESVERIEKKADGILKDLTVKDLLNRFRVEYIATTDNATADLHLHGKYGDTTVSPTFRPDSILAMDEKELEKLGEICGSKLATVKELKAALASRLQFFRAHGCKIADHGMDFLPVADCGEKKAEALYEKRAGLSACERWELASHLIYFLAEEYAKEDMVMQLHFATFRNVNKKMFASIGRDTGYDIMRGEVDTDALVAFFDTLCGKNALPKTVIYSLNPACVPALATLSGAFPRVRVGAAWWFNDTACGIKKQLEVISEYAVLGTNLGMLTDSRSFASYARFDFFRRILSDFVGGYVERGEYDMAAAKELMQDVCYRNVKEFLGI